MIPVLEEIRVPRQAGGRPRTRPDHVGGDKAYSSPETGVTCADAKSNTPSPSRESSEPTASAAAAKVAGPRGSTRRSTDVAKKSSGPSTGSRIFEPWPHATTRGRMSFTARSPWPRSGYGSAVDQPARLPIRASLSHHNSAPTAISTNMTTATAVRQSRTIRVRCTFSGMRSLKSARFGLFGS